MRSTPNALLLIVLLAIADLGAALPVAATESDRGTRLDGRAFLGRRQGVVGASVVARPSDDPARVWVTSTDGRGRFRLDDLPDGAYTVAVSRDGLQPVRKSGVTLRFPFRAVVELQMEPGETAPTADASSAAGGREALELAGVVREPDGRPLPDTMLRLVSRDASADPRLVRSGPGGRFAFDELPAGRWAIDVRGVGYLPIRTDVPLEEDTTLLVRMIPQPADYLPSPLELMPPEVAIPPVLAAPALEAEPADAEPPVDVETTDDQSPLRTAK